MLSVAPVPTAPLITLRADLGAIVAAYIPWDNPPTLIISTRLSETQVAEVIRQVASARPCCARIIHLEEEVEQCANP